MLWSAVLSATCALVLLGFLVINATLLPRQPQVIRIDLAVSDLAKAKALFTEVLTFTPLTRQTDDGAIVVRLGDEEVVLHQRPIGKTRSAPLAANDVRFEHLALVVADIDRAAACLRSAGVELISGLPQHLPAWNRDVRGIAALYFRDEDGHFLEVIQFPSRLGEPRWQAKDGPLFLGIDHTAVVVTDSARSAAFYRDALGFTRAGESFNSGPEQAALSGVAGAEVLVTSLRGIRGMGIELLQYLHPEATGATASADWQVHIAAYRRPVQDALADPDGHALIAERGSASRLDDAADAIRAHWQRYLMEGGELGIFMVATIWMTLLLEHPDSPLRRRLASALLRRVLMGLAIATTAALLINSTWGSQSGAQFNPAITLANLQMGRIGAWDALFYVIAQFIGGWLGVVLAALPFRKQVQAEEVAYAGTVPRLGGVGLTLVAEAAIAFLLLAVLLLAQRAPALKSQLAYCAGALLFCYIVCESPISGMSLNPARTMASAIPAGKTAGVWPYFLAPIAGMQLAAAIFGR